MEQEEKPKPTTTVKRERTRKMSNSFLSRSFSLSRKKTKASANNNTIYEKESPLNHTVCGAPIKSPRSKFQQNNSNPIPETISCPTFVQETPKKIDDSRQQKSLGKFLRYLSPNSRKKKNQSNHDDSFKLNEHISSVLSDELNISSKASPQQKVSQVYETSINKHGDMVDYAVPYSEYQPPLINDSVSTLSGSETCDNLLDEPEWNGRLIDMRIVNPVKITDLDKSSVGYMSLNQIDKGMDDYTNRDGLSELGSLERWSQNLTQRSLYGQEQSIDTRVHIIKCKPREIKPKRSVLRNTISLPLHFSSGFFRKTPVTLRKCCPRDSLSVGIVAEAIERDLDILNKVKHSNIILLMAASFQKTLEQMALVLEPVDYTLNYFLHRMDTKLSTVDSISVVQQIASAASYLQECGYIHSNISSHSILVRENPWCVKLSSFELTTDVDFANTRAEIMIKYRHNLSPFINQCTNDKPRYGIVQSTAESLKDQYRQISKLLPMLKCSPNTQHKYFSMLSKHLIYNTNYRQHLSLHNFQAPELLTTKLHFVFPTTKADVYALCLLLWEMLNNCVPFVVYSKLDMERMIEAKKMNLPIFEQDRCRPFKDIFKIGLALNPEHRTIDLQQLSTLLEDIKYRIRNGIKDIDQEQHIERNNVNQEVNLCVNADPEQHPMNNCFSVGSIESLNSMDFNRRLIENEVTSTKSSQRQRSPQKLIKKKVFRQLFKNSTKAVNSEECESVLSHAQSNDQLETIASELRSDLSLHEIQGEEDECNFNSIGTPLSFEENEFQSNNSLVKETDRGSSNLNTEWRKTSPDIVDFDVADENQSPNSKSCSNLFDDPISGQRGRHFHCNVVPPPDYVGEYPLPDTPIAHKNKIRRNAWLSNKSLQLSNSEIDEPATMENKDESLNDSNQLNVSIRIVHNKVTPKKAYGENPVVRCKSRMKSSHSEKETSTRPTSFTKTSSNNDRVGNVDSNYSANYPIKDSSCKELVELEINAENPSSFRSAKISRTLSNCSTLPMSQTVTSFENKFRKRDLSICNRSSGSDDDANIKTPKWQSVRDMILKFEKCGMLSTQPPLPLTTATEFVGNLSKSQSDDIKVTEAPTVIKRTIYSESTVKVSSLDLASLDNQKPLFDQLNNLSGQKLTTQVTLNMRQIRRRSSDFEDPDRAKIEGSTGLRHTVCGSQKGLLSFNSTASKDGSSGGKTKYICSDCTTKMTSDELSALKFESVAESTLSATNVTDHSLSSSIVHSQTTPQRHCQVRVKPQKTRSIEDLYIDDDFDQELGLGANIELHSDSSDFLNFDNISDAFNNSNVDT